MKDQHLYWSFDGQEDMKVISGSGMANATKIKLSGRWTKILAFTMS